MGSSPRRSPPRRWASLPRTSGRPDGATAPGGGRSGQSRGACGEVPPNHRSRYGHMSASHRSYAMLAEAVAQAVIEATARVPRPACPRGSISCATDVMWANRSVAESSVSVRTAAARAFRVSLARRSAPLRVRPGVGKRARLPQAALIAHSYARQAPEESSSS